MANPIDRSVSELRKLQAARNTLETEAAEDQARLAELRSKLGDVELAALLDGDDSGPIRREIINLETKLAGRAAARPKLLQKIREALRALGHERAAVKRKEAEKLRGKLAEHQAETARLKKALEDQEGIRYDMATWPIIPPGLVFAQGEIPPLPPSIGMRMEAQISELLAEAARIEAAAEQATQGGRISGSTLADLLAVCDNVEMIPPTRASIEGWYHEGSARADIAWATTLEDFPGGQVKPVRELFCVLVWDSSGLIDRAQSQAVNRQTARADAVWTGNAWVTAGAGNKAA